MTPLELPSRPNYEHFGPYEVIRTLGRGGMGTVYEVRHADTGVHYALKALLQNWVGDQAQRVLERFRREVSALARVDAHPGIVHVHGSGVEGDVPYFVMELVPGRPLGDQLREGPLSARNAARLVLRVAAALHHAHGQGVVHRDLKPANVLLTPEGAPQLVDFGLCHDLVFERLTQTGELVGTPAFMAPEQLKNHRVDLDPQIDVYGLGAVLYACLTGQSPHSGAEGHALLVAVMRERPEAPSVLNPQVPAGIEAICQKAMEPDRQRRYLTMEEFATDLNRWLEGKPMVASLRAGPLEAGRIVTLGVAAGLMVALAGGYLWWTGYGGSASQVTVTEAATPPAVTEPLDVRLDAALAAAAGEDVSGLEVLAQELGGLSEVPPGLELRAQAVSLLVRIHAGDEQLLRRLRVDLPPWDQQSEALVGVLLAAGHWPALLDVLRLRPGLLPGPDQTERVVAATMGLTLRRSVLKGLDHALEFAALESQTSSLVRHFTELRLTLLSERVRRALADPVVRPEAVLEASAALLAIIRRQPPKTRLDEESLARLVDLVNSNTDSKLQGMLLEAAISLLPLGDPRASDLHQRLRYNTLSAALIEGGNKRPAFQRALMTVWVRQWPFRIWDLQDVAPVETDLLKCIQREVAHGVDHAAISDLAVYASILLIRRLELARGESGDLTQATTVVLSEEQSSELIEVILERERRCGDVPAWMLSWLGRRVARTFWDRDERAEEQDANLVEFSRKMLAVLDPGLKVEAGREAEALGGKLLAMALERDRVLPPVCRTLEVVTGHCRWQSKHAPVSKVLALVPDMLDAVEIVKFNVARSQLLIGVSTWGFHRKTMFRGMLADFTERLSREAKGEGAVCKSCQEIEALVEELKGLKELLPSGREAELLDKAHQALH